MGYISALERIIRFINDQRMTPMKRWSNRYGIQPNQKHPYIRRIKKNTRIILNLISGHDIVNMMKSN